MPDKKAKEGLPPQFALAHKKQNQLLKKREKEERNESVYVC